MTIILVSGVSDGADREPDRRALETYFGEPVELFDPERYMKRPLLAKILAFLPMGGKAYDVLDYVALQQAAPEVNKHLRQMIEKFKPTMLVGHSLGSVIVAHYMTENKGFEVMTIGSPLWMPRFIWHMVDLVKVAKNAKFWINIYSPKDLIGLYPLKEAHQNIKVLSPHALTSYLKATEGV